MASKPEEKGLIDGLRQGREDAYRRLVEEFSDKLYRLALRILREEEDARDVLQEVFAKVVQKIADFQGDSSLYTWLYRVTVNEALMRRRRMRLNSLLHGALLRLFRLLTCREIERLSYDFLEGSLEARLSDRIRRHLGACPKCLRFMNSYRKTKEMGRSLERPPLDPAFKREMLAFLLAERLR